MDASDGAAHVGDAIDPNLRVRKWDVIDRLRSQIGAHSYAHIVSASTSPDMLGRPELARFGIVSGLQYSSELQRAEWAWARQLPTLDGLAGTVRTQQLAADIVFADPWHTYDDSMRVMKMAYDMVNPGGYLVVHDCSPLERDHARPEPLDWVTFWCGDTWRAFADFTFGLGPTIDWWVLDNDLGVGVVPRPPQRGFDVVGSRLRRRRRHPRRLPAEWDFERAWTWLDEDRRQRLRLVTVEEWRQASIQLD